MMGTLASVLASRKISTAKNRYQAEVEGDIESVDGVLRITRIRVCYSLQAPADMAPAISECFATYLDRCPAAMSVRGAIEIEHRIELRPDDRG